MRLTIEILISAMSYTYTIVTAGRPKVADDGELLPFLLLRILEIPALNLGRERSWLY
jgi:hypothetical protein